MVDTVESSLYSSPLDTILHQASDLASGVSLPNQTSVLSGLVDHLPTSGFHAIAAADLVTPDFNNPDFALDPSALNTTQVSSLLAALGWRSDDIARIQAADSASTSPETWASPYPTDLAPETPTELPNPALTPAIDLQPPPAPTFASFSIQDASGDSTGSTLFQGGVLQFSYTLADAASVTSVQLQALDTTGNISTLASWMGTSLSNYLLSPSSLAALSTGTYQFRAVAYTNSGQDVVSSSQAISILPTINLQGTFRGETFNYDSGLGTGTVVEGAGGTDSLNLGSLTSTSVVSLNGQSLSAYNPLTTPSQAIFNGTAFDYLSLADGREIYFQGIENLQFSDRTLELQVHPTDPFFYFQWNLHVTDVEDAWRFTQGSSNVLLASLDTGITQLNGQFGSIFDLTPDHLIARPSDDDNTNSFGHGQSAINVMTATPNNGRGGTGINWNSSVFVNDVYGSGDGYSRVTLQQAISDTIAYARANHLKVVFQGGIQGEGWLNDGGTQAQLEQLIADNADIALFVIAAGNGGPGGNFVDSNYLNSVSGVAKLAATHENVISVGALVPGNETNYWYYAPYTGTTVVNGLYNASDVSLASYSNRGSNLTLVAPTDSPVIDRTGNLRYLGGTSGANPNLAAIASLVWSADSNLSGAQVRQLLTDTAMDLGTPGRDDTYGSGLVDADAAVRRAWALSQNPNLVALYPSESLTV